MTTKITYKTTWREMWSKEEATYTTIEEAVKMAKMKKGMGYKDVKVVKVEETEIEF